jgi:hypothetical protein
VGLHDRQIRSLSHVRCHGISFSALTGPLLRCFTLSDDEPTDVDYILGSKESGLNRLNPKL